VILTNEMQRSRLESDQVAIAIGSIGLSLMAQPRKANAIGRSPAKILTDKAIPGFSATLRDKTTKANV
jgi:hypothetical protein